MSISKLQDRKYTCIIDDVEYHSKPLGESHTITSRLTYKGNESYTLDEIAEAVSKGRTLLPFNFQTHKSGKILGKKNEYFKETDLVLLDIDGGMTLEAMYKMHEKVGISPNLVYKSFSHTEAYHKF